MTLCSEITLQAGLSGANIFQLRIVQYEFKCFENMNDCMQYIQNYKVAPSVKLLNGERLHLYAKVTNDTGRLFVSIPINPLNRSSAE